MKIKGSPTSLLASLIINGAISFIKFRVKDVKITDEFIYKLYYEVETMMDHFNLDEIVDQDQFTDVMVKSLHLLEGEIDEKLEEDPEFIERLMDKHSWLWSLYKTFRNFVTSENIKNIRESKVSQEINRQINNTIINDDKLLDYKVKRDVDYALADIPKPEDPKINTPESYYEEGETPLGIIGIRSKYNQDSKDD